MSFPFRQDYAPNRRIRLVAGLRSWHIGESRRFAPSSEKRRESRCRRREFLPGIGRPRRARCHWEAVCGILASGAGMAKIGTDKHAAAVRVATEQRALEIIEQCERRGIKVIIGIEPGKQEDITDVERILRRPAPVKVVKARPRITGSDYCPCGSGKKYKKCCGSSSQLETSASRRRLTPSLTVCRGGQKPFAIGAFRRPAFRAYYGASCTWPPSIISGHEGSGRATGQRYMIPISAQCTVGRQTRSSIDPRPWGLPQYLSCIRRGRLSQLAVQSILLNSAIQLVSQVLPPSPEKACSQWAAVAVMPDQVKRTLMGLPRRVSSE